jgi:hypothetical protein
MAKLRGLTAEQSASLFLASREAVKQRASARKIRREDRVRSLTRQIRREIRQARDVERALPVERVGERRFEVYSRDLASMGWYLCEQSAWDREDLLSRGTPWPLTLGWCLATAGMLAYQRR